MKSRKELKEEYKLKKFRMGVFQIRNTVNGKIYIDCSVNLDAIFNRHRVQLNFGNHPNSDLQDEWKEFGEENFKYEILSEIDQKDGGTTTDYNKEIKTLTEMYIDELQPYNTKGYHQQKIKKIK